MIYKNTSIELVTTILSIEYIKQGLVKVLGKHILYIYNLKILNCIFCIDHFVHYCVELCICIGLQIKYILLLLEIFSKRSQTFFLGVKYA